jgi:anti-sigma B factor antagonist
MSSELIINEELLACESKIRIEGEVDIYTAQKFKEKLYNAVDAADKDLAIDCDKLNYIDSTGLGIFVGALKKARMADKNIHLLNVRGNIKKLFIITGLDKLFIIE